MAVGRLEMVRCTGAEEVGAAVSPANANPDLSSQRVTATDFVGVQPGVGDSINRYHGLDDGNSDLFKADNSGLTDSGDAPDIYMGIAENPDIQF